MTIPVTLLDLKKAKAADKIDLLLLVGKEKQSYPITVFDEEGILGISCPGKLQMLLASNAKVSKDFIAIVLQFYKGYPLDVPIDLGEV